MWLAETVVTQLPLCELGCGHSSSDATRPQSYYSYVGLVSWRTFLVLCSGNVAPKNLRPANETLVLGPVDPEPKASRFGGFFQPGLLDMKLFRWEFGNHVL